MNLLTRGSTAVPDDYDDLLSYYTKRGYRVIAVAGKSIEGLSWLKAQKMKRYVLESLTSFLNVADRVPKGASRVRTQISGSRHLREQVKTGNFTGDSSPPRCTSTLQDDHGG
jgi:cation-transporting ATPase 13A2